MYRYYSTQRPVAPGSFPRPSTAQNVHNFDTRQMVESINRPAWGYVDYPCPLTEKEQADYELVKGEWW